MIKSLLVAAACAVLSLSGGGLALASNVTPLPANPGNDVSGSCTITVGNTCVISTGPLAGQTCVGKVGDAVGVLCTKHGRSGNHDNHPGNGHGNFPGGPVRGGPVYSDCNDARSHGYRDVRRGDSRFNDSWDRNRDGIACDDGDVVILNSNGDCTTYAVARDSIRNYANDYNRLRGVYKNDWSKYSRSDRDNLNRLYSLNHRYVSEGWNSTKLSQLRTVCNDSTPPVTIINEAPQVVAAPPVSDNPTPLGSSGGQVTVKPSGGAETGDGSTLLR